MAAAKAKPKKYDGRFDLRHGPYLCPPTRRGKTLFCENHGTVKVFKFSDGPITWPMCLVGKRGRAYILCGDLVRAIRLEAAGAVARAWGVHKQTVTTWRRILGVERFNAGTHQLFLKYQGKGLTAAATARGRAMQTPARQVNWGHDRREEGRTRKRKWTPEEDALLGKITDDDVARRLGCSRTPVVTRRRDLGIASFAPQYSATRVLKLLRYSADKMRAKRLKAGLFQTEASARCGWQTPAMYQRLESGRQVYATAVVLARVAKALNCRVVDFI